MRHILYLLLVANLVYLGWNLLQGSTNPVTEAALPPLPASVRPLVTLQESRQQTSAVTGNETGSDMQGPGENSADPQADQAAQYTPGASAAVTPASGLNALNSEQPPGAGQSDGSDCQALGPFDLEDEVKAVAARLDALGLKARRRTAQVREANGYWVYLPSMPHEAALEITRKLTEAGDSDYFIGRENYIALGTYHDVAGAEARLRQVRQLGLDAEMAARYRTRNTYWLEFDRKAAVERDITGIMQDRPQLQLHALACL